MGPDKARSRSDNITAKAFTKLFEALDIEPTYVGGEDARDVHPAESSNKAIEQLKELGRSRWPTLSEAQQFARAFTDPANAELAKRAHVRPVAPASGAYPFPR